MTPRGLDDELLALAVSDPRRALGAVDRALAEELPDPHVHARVLRAGGLAARNTGDLERSNAYLSEALSPARKADTGVALIEVQITRAGNILLAGDPTQALRLLTSLGPVDDPALAAKVEIQIGTLYARTSRFHEALDYLSRALRHAEQAEDLRQQAGILKNIGLLRTYDGDYAGANADLSRARSMFLDIGIDLEAAYCLHNLGLVAAYSGDLPTAFEWFSQAEATIAEFAGYEWEVQVGRVEALLSAGLADEAIESGTHLANTAAAADHQLERGEALRAVAQAHFLRGEYADAHTLATDLVKLFVSQGRLGWSAYARLLALRSARAAEMAVDPQEASALVSELGEARLANAELEARIVEADLMADVDSEAALSRLRAIGSRVRRAPVDLRIGERTTTARARLAGNDRRGADRAAREAIDMLLAYQQLLGAGDLRVGVSFHGREAIEIGIRLAVESGRPRRIFDWLERAASSRLRLRDVVPQRDPELREALTELRSISASIDQTSGPIPSNLQRRRRQAERKVIDRYRATPDAGSHSRSARAVEVIAGLGEETLISYGTMDDDTFAVKLRHGKATLHRLGPTAAIDRATRAARADLRRLATGVATVAPIGSLRRLDGLLLGGVGAVGDSVAVIPTPGLFAVPWGGLPSMERRRVSVTPSAALHIGRDRQRDGRVAVLASGPDMEEGTTEIAAVRQVLPEAIVLVGEDATTSKVIEAIDGSEVAHIAAHGHIRTDNPLFSSLEMADGPLNVYEFEMLARQPDIVVLSACHVGLPAADPGRELLGLVGAMLSLGTRTVIASTLPLPDNRQTVDYMVRLHEAMAAGQRPSEASLTAALTTEDPALYRSAITVFGAG